MEFAQSHKMKQKEKGHTNKIYHRFIKFKHSTKLGFPPFNLPLISKVTQKHNHKHTNPQCSFLT